jgi:hypothetical protein
MRNLIGLLLLMTFISCSSKSIEKNHTIESKKEVKRIKWLIYRDTVNKGFILTFKYPNNLVAESIENGRCIGKPKKQETSDDDVTNTMQWCIWMTNIDESESIDSLINSEKYFFKGQVTEQRQNITINNTKALLVKYISNKKNDPYKQIIILNKYSTLFEIVNNYGDEKGFEMFYKSITINEIKKSNL